ncbi:MAG: glycoside hydrolase family 95 protein, partial [Planctomycetota bacterium]
MKAQQVRAKNIKRKVTSPTTRNSVVFICYFLAFSLITTVCATNHIYQPGSNRLDVENFRGMKLWYRQPAQEWTQALPVGNGRLGAMVFGGTENERLQFNDDTLWTGQPHEYHHEGAVKYLPAVRKLLFEGKQREAEELAMEQMMSVPLRQEKYQPFGDLRLNFPGHAEPDDYRRELDIDKAVVNVSYRIGDVTFTREVFSSYPDQVIVVRLTCNKPGQLTFTVKLDSPHTNARTLVVDKNLVLRGRISEYTDRRTKSKKNSVLKFEARLGWQAEGGKAEVTSDALEVKDADSVTLILAAATSFKNFSDVSGDPAAACRRVIEAAANKNYNVLCKTHIDDHRRLFRRAALELGINEAAEQPTDERIENFPKQDDPQLVELYFQFGRYLLIASS